VNPTGSSPCFIKPAEDTKAFSGIIEPRDQMLDYLRMELPADLPVLCAEIVSFVAEYRIYLVNGETLL
jgi:hypothetical protein